MLLPYVLVIGLLLLCQVRLLRRRDGRREWRLRLRDRIR